MEEIIIELRSWFRTNGLMDFELFGNKIPKDEHGKYITYTCKDVEEQFKIALDKFKKLPIHNVSKCACDNVDDIQPYYDIDDDIFRCDKCDKHFC